MTTQIDRQTIPGNALPLLPVSNGAVFPAMVVTIRAETTEARKALDAALAADHELLILPRTGKRFALVGTVARIEQSGSLPDGTLAAVVRGVRRARVGQGVLGETAALWVETTAVSEPAASAETDALVEQYRELAEQLLEAAGNSALRGLLTDVSEPGELADTISYWPGLSVEQRVELLETVSVDARLELAAQWARHALVELSVSSSINSEVSDHFATNQREAILRRQLEAIRKELGETDDASSGYRERLATLSAPDAVLAAIGKEVDRLERSGEQSMEASWIRGWLDAVLEVPWAISSEDNLDLDRATTILDADHSGLADVKSRIIEFLAVRKLRNDRGPSGTAAARTGTIIVLVGPPGVGKTSLGESVARALGRKFVRTALGGIHDEAEIRGHRRTYVGARPGRIARALIDAGTKNPVILLDEIDKVGNDYRGDPSAALLEVLDPAQNATFRDNYLELDLDLSDVLFIATANTLERVPAPLLDRMEVITLSGYDEDEKLTIARDHLLGRVLQRNAVTEQDVVISDDILRAVISDYTHEAGVRRLEQRLDRLVRKSAARVARAEVTSAIRLELEDLRPALGPVPPRERPQQRIVSPGVATGLAVTAAGGDVLFVEAVAMPGDVGLTLTGQLGEVMRESGEIALSYLRSHASALGIDPPALDRRFHVHFPAGSVPKDGPSAGVTMTTALASLLLQRTVRSDIAMTGEMTLQGRVLPIGGVKEKILAAHRAGVALVILPEANRNDAEDVPAAVRAAVELRFVADVSEVLELALGGEAR